MEDQITNLKIKASVENYDKVPIDMDYNIFCASGCGNSMIASDVPIHPDMIEMLKGALCSKCDPPSQAMEDAVRGFKETPGALESLGEMVVKGIDK